MSEIFLGEFEASKRRPFTPFKTGVIWVPGRWTGHFLSFFSRKNSTVVPLKFGACFSWFHWTPWKLDSERLEKIGGKIFCPNSEPAMVASWGQKAPLLGFLFVRSGFSSAYVHGLFAGTLSFRWLVWKNSKKSRQFDCSFFGYLVSYPMAHPWDEAIKNQRHPWIPVPWMGRMGNHHDPTWWLMVVSN